MANYKDIKYDIPGDRITSGSIPDGRVTSSSVTQHVEPYISWQSVQTSNFTAVAGRGYPVNTSSSAITVTAPSSPSVGDTIKLTDYDRTFNTNNLTFDVTTGGGKYQGASNNPVFATRGATIVLTYFDSTRN